METIFTATGATSNVAISGTENTQYNLNLDNVQSKSNLRFQNLSWAGGSTSHDFPLSGVTTSSPVQAEIASSTNPCSITSRKVNTPGFITVQFSADPGAVVISVSAAIVPQ